MRPQALPHSRFWMLAPNRIAQTRTRTCTQGRGTPKPGAQHTQAHTSAHTHTLVLTSLVNVISKCCLNSNIPAAALPHPDLAVLCRTPEETVCFLRHLTQLPLSQSLGFNQVIHSFIQSTTCTKRGYSARPWGYPESRTNMEPALLVHHTQLNSSGKV